MTKRCQTYYPHVTRTARLPCQDDRMLVFRASVPCALLLTSLLQASTPDDTAREIFKQLIEINTTDSVGNAPQPREAMAKRLLDAGFPASRRASPRPQRPQRNLVARIARHRAAQADPLHRPSRRRRSAPRRLDHRSLPIRRERRLLLRPRHPGHEGRRRHPRHRLHSPQERGLQSGSRPDPRAYSR